MSGVWVVARFTLLITNVIHYFMFAFTGCLQNVIFNSFRLTDFRVSVNCFKVCLHWAKANFFSDLLRCSVWTLNWMSLYIGTKSNAWINWDDHENHYNALFKWFRQIFTARNEVAKVMFLHVSVILFTGRLVCVLSQHALQVVSQHALQQGWCYPSMPCSGRCLLLGEGSAPGGVCSGGWGKGVGVESRRLLYASYCNAFLFIVIFAQIINWW